MTLLAATVNQLTEICVSMAPLRGAFVFREPSSRCRRTGTSKYGGEQRKSSSGEGVARPCNNIMTGHHRSTREKEGSACHTLVLEEHYSSRTMPYLYHTVWRYTRTATAHQMRFATTVGITMAQGGKIPIPQTTGPYWTRRARSRLRTAPMEAGMWFRVWDNQV